jgi:hypothetical protein
MARSASLLYWRAMNQERRKFSAGEAFLCAWVVVAQLWYFWQFRSLLAALTSRFLHRS